MHIVFYLFSQKLIIEETQLKVFFGDSKQVLSVKQIIY